MALRHISLISLRRRCQDRIFRVTSPVRRAQHRSGATAALQETESPPKRVRRKQSLKHTGDEAKDTAIQAVESVSAFGDAALQAPTGSPQTLFNTHPRDLVDRYRKQVQVSTGSARRRKWARFQQLLQNGDLHRAFQVMKQEINGGNLGPDEFHMGRVSAFVHAANSELLTANPHRVRKIVMLMEEMIRYFKMNQPSFSDRGLMAQFIVAYGTAFTRLAPGHYDMTMIIRRTVTPLMKHFAPKGKGLNELFREAQATPAVYAMAQPTFTVSYPDIDFLKYDKALEIRPKDTGLDNDQLFFEQWENEAFSVSQLAAVPTLPPDQKDAYKDAEVSAKKARKNKKKNKINPPLLPDEHPARIQGYEGIFKPCWTAFRDAVAADRDDFFDRKARLRHTDHGVYLYAENTLTCENITDIVFTEFDALLRNPFGIMTSMLCSNISQRLYQLHFANLTMENLNEEDYCMYHEYRQYLQDKELTKQYSGPEYWQLLEKKYKVNSVPNSFASQWPADACVRVGSAMIQMFMENTSMRQILGHKKKRDLAVAWHTYEFDGHQQSGIVRLNEELCRYSEKAEATVTRSYSTASLPMLVPPKPWLSLRHGPFLVTPANIMRCSDETFQHLALLAAANNSLGAVYDALSYLGSTRWRINTTILDMATECFQTGVSYEPLSIPQRVLAKPVKPDDEELRGAFRHECNQVEKQQRENISYLADLQHKLTVASTLRKRDFWLPHNMDFRGRTYPCAPHLNHLGSDLTRAMMVFGEGKKLGDDGLRWLKVHLSNVCGNDKCSFDDRVKFTEDHLHHVFETADYARAVPDGGELQWWQQQDKPWQVLATCQELAAALRSPDPTEFISHLPVHQDGTCNGLQHYAALGGDTKGAIAVNLAPGEKPSDVYSEVARRACRILDRHAEGQFLASDSLPSRFPTKKDVSECAVRLKAHLADPGVRRKVFKQTVMTSVYGVTYIGARAQIAKQLKGLNISTKKTIREDSLYLATLTFASLQEMFSAAQAIQIWLGNCALDVSKSKAPMTWLTPLNLPVIQPYHKKKFQTITTPFQMIRLPDDTNYDKSPNSQKQKTAFPPNFIHSLDSSHMMLTAIACRKQGIAFASVHDSYWTHASTVQGMRDNTRQEFVRLHSQPLLQNLTAFLKMHYDGRSITDAGKAGKRVVDISPPPTRGDFDINEVLNSEYFFN